MFRLLKAALIAALLDWLRSRDSRVIGASVDSCLNIAKGYGLAEAVLTILFSIAIKSHKTCLV